MQEAASRKRGGCWGGQDAYPLHGGGGLYTFTAGMRCTQETKGLPFDVNPAFVFIVIRQRG